ncbi:MAG: glutaredoxin family protein [Methanomicrobium sp.]|nr:glutaredoxin family protein [Methanomicrobium sp.]MDD4300008.1 glutaredoxin family protein [Methanomicrobium sp.]
MAEWTHFQGEINKNVRLYALSTCGHCKITREFLEDNKITYDYLYIDLLSQDELEAEYSKMKEFNPEGSFPTLVAGGKDVVIGSRFDEIKKVLGLND